MALALLLLCPDAKDHFTGIAPHDDDTLPKKFYNRLYLAATSLSAVGYGDVAPRSITARALAMLASVFVVTVALSHLHQPVPK